jgi:hypothetical protein
LRITSNSVFSSAGRPQRPAAAAIITGHAAASGGLDAVGVLHVLAELDRVLEGQAGEFVAEFFDVRAKSWCRTWCPTFP